jgi:membrane-associated phospholipid phosphatase
MPNRSPVRYVHLDRAMPSSVIGRQRRISNDPDAPSRRHHLALAAAVGGSVALLATFVARLDIDEQWAIDRRVRETLRLRTARRTRLALRVTERAGMVAVYAPAAALAMAYIARRRGPARALPIGGAVAAAAALGFVLKQLVKRPRPVGPNGPINSHPSFPSGHAARATALTGILAYVAVRERIASPFVATPLAAGIALATGASRAYSDAHWTTDVIGGWATGVTAMAGGAMAYERIRAREHR